MSDYVQKYISYHLDATKSNEAWAEYLDSNIDSQFVNLIMSEKSKLLYVGSGTGGFFHFFKKAALIHAVDSNQDMILVAKNPPNSHLMSPECQIVTSTEIPQGVKFDVVFYSPFSTYEAITNSRLEQLASLLNENGSLVFHFPNRFEKKEFFGQTKESCKVIVKTILNIVLQDRYFLKFDIRVCGALTMLSARVERVTGLRFSYSLKNNNLFCVTYTKTS